jgi:hypothetical protein
MFKVFNIGPWGPFLNNFYKCKVEFIGVKLPANSYRAVECLYLCFRLQVTDYRLQVTDYSSKATDYKLQATDYKYAHREDLGEINYPHNFT